MVEKTKPDYKNAKRLPKGQRTHNRRLKQAARKDPGVPVKVSN